ncbi:MAG: Head fiber protein [Clostridia bacterium]|nr:Head fiber protein [Clostridia bacterium]
MSNMARNYHAHGGAEWVVGGKLTFLPGATVEGAEGLFDVPSGAGAVQLPYLEDSKATSAASLREDYNKLLAALRTAGLMAAAPTAETEADQSSENKSGDAE